MAKKKARAKDKPALKPKSLRKQLRRAQADLGKAVAKRDRAQARVDALSIITDEIRARLAEVERPPTEKEEEAAKTGSSAKAAPAAKKPTPAKKPTAAKKPPVSTRQGAARKATAAKPKTATSPKEPSAKSDS